MADRFYVRESFGYPIILDESARFQNGPLITEVCVLDRDYCHEVVWSSETRSVWRTKWSGGYRNGRQLTPMRNLPLTERRAHAHALAAQLNEGENT